MAELMTTPDYIAQHPETVQKVVRAMKRSLDYIHAHSTDDIVKTVEPFFGARVQPELLKASVETVKAATVRDGYLTDGEVATTVQLLRESGKQMPDFTVKDIFTDRFLKELK
jgi:ABC-type nitrate/sulfonate/bicarbonate transport system substrate-binding protein